MHPLIVFGFMLVLVTSGFRLPAHPISPSAEDPAVLRKLLEEAVDLHRSEEWREAAEKYRLFLDFVPDNPQVRSNLGVVYAAQGLYTEAIGQYREALSLDPSHPGILFNLGVAYHKSGMPDQAVDAFRGVLEVEPDNRNALLLKADSHFQLGDNAGVVELLAPKVADHEDDPAFLYLLGTALIREGELEGGQRLVDRILRRGDSAEAQIMLGVAHQMGRDQPAALQYFRRAVELNPGLSTAHSLYGSALLATGDPQGAREAFYKELEINPNDFAANFYLGVLYKTDFELEKALTHLEKADRVRPGSPEVLYQIGSLHVQAGSNREALEVLGPLVEQEPDFVEAHVSLATVYFRLGRREEGERHRRIVEELTAEKQALAPGADEELGPAYRGEDRTQVPRPRQP